MVRRLLKSLAVAGVAAAVFATAPAYAWETPGGSGAGDDSETGETPTSSTGGSSGSGGGEGVVGNCHAVANSNYLGLACYNGGGGGGETRSIEEILGDDELPECWHEPMTERELEALSLQNSPDSTWYWERCLEGIDPQTLEIGPDGVDVSVGYVALGAGDDVITLTANQQELIDTFRLDGDATIPAPVAGVSPASRPRVGAWVSFFNGTDSEVTANAGAMVLRAAVTRIDVEPLGEGKAPLLTCSGNGYEAQKGDTPDTVSADACWHKYEQSSAGEPDQKYPVRMTTHWAVQYSQGGGGWQPFVGFGGSPVTFTKSQVTNHPVTEIQALVIR